MCFDIREMLGIKDIASEVNRMKKDIRNTLTVCSTETHTFTVQKPFCCPASPIIKQALDPYGVKIVAIGSDRVSKISTKDFAQMMRIEFKRFDNLKYGPGMFLACLPMTCECTVTVRKTQAEWAEYLIERTKRMCVVEGNINSKNRAWANQYNGEMPKPWIETSCSEGNKIWSQVDTVMKESTNDVQRKAK